MTTTSPKKVAFVIAPSLFRDEEYFQPKVILQAKGVLVNTVARGDMEEISGSQGGKARTDAKLETVTLDAYDGLVFVGGKGSKQYFKNRQMHTLAQDFIKAGKVVGAICSAVGILANADVLKGRKVTGYHKEQELVKKSGGVFKDEGVVVDKKLVTARDVDSAIKFGEELGKALGIH